MQAAPIRQELPRPVLVAEEILATGASQEGFAEAYAWVTNDEALMNIGRAAGLQPSWTPDRYPRAGRGGWGCCAGSSLRLSCRRSILRRS